MPASATTPTRSPSSTRPNSTACTVSVLAKVLPTAKFLQRKQMQKQQHRPDLRQRPANAQSTKAPFGRGTPCPCASTATSSTAHGTAKRNRA